MTSAVVTRDEGDLHCMKTQWQLKKVLPNAPITIRKPEIWLAAEVHLLVPLSLPLMNLIERNPQNLFAIISTFLPVIDKARTDDNNIAQGMIIYDREAQSKKWEEFRNEMEKVCTTVMLNGWCRLNDTWKGELIEKLKT